VRGNPSGERCAAQPSGRPHEPSGNRRPQMDGHRPSTRVGGHRTRLTDRLADTVAAWRSMRALPLAVLAHARPSALAPVLSGAFAWTALQRLPPREAR
jgi:hypothetical protein